MMFFLFVESCLSERIHSSTFLKSALCPFLENGNVEPDYTGGDTTNYHSVLGKQDWKSGIQTTGASLG